MLNVVILAAGLGKRMQSDLPKVLHPIAGQPMLAHILDTARQLKPARLVVVVGHGADRVKAAFNDASDIIFVHQQPQHGTGHAVQQAVPSLATDEGSSTLVLYGDVPMVQASTLRTLLEAQAQNSSLAILTETVADPRGYGRILRDTDEAIVGIVEERDATARQQAIQEVNTGMLAANTRLLTGWLDRLDNHNAQAEYYLTDIVKLAVADGHDVQASQPGTSWETRGVNSRAQQAGLERAWQTEQAQRLMEQGVTLADPARIDIRGRLSCGRDVFIDVGCVFEGEVQLADGVQVGPYAVLRDVTVSDGAMIRAYSHLDGAQVGKEATIGPYARLRPGTQLGERVQVGNFVEIKNARFGNDSKSSHLAYIGDAEVGERVNIGAGAITCNYDGANKNQTIIEDDVFIGSDTQLVAPVRIERGATIGAGTTLTQDAPEGRLTLSRAQQKTVFGWTRPRPRHKS